jgi:hypothetical protein
MPASRAWPAALALSLLVPATARAEHFQFDAEEGGGLVFPVHPVSARSNYRVAGPEFLLRLGGVGERFLLHVTGSFGFLTYDTDTLTAELRSLRMLPKGADHVSSGAAWFASGVAGAGLFVVGNGTSGGVYLGAGIGGGATWAPRVKFLDGYDLVMQDAALPSAAPPFGFMQPRLVLSAAIGAHTGKTKGPGYLSAAIELGSKWWLCNGAPVGMITLTAQFGFMVPE